MIDPATTGLTVIADAVSNLPAPVKTPFFKALGTLLGGLTAIPSAWVKRPAQATEDVTSGRSMVSAALAKAVADEAVKDVALMQAAAEIYLPSAVRKARNRVGVAQSATEHVAEAKTENVEGALPDDDWMNKFMRFAEDASSERLQDLFGRILAGEVVRPGSFSTATLRAISELDQSIATDFSDAWAKSVGDAVDYGPEWQRGPRFSSWKRLSEAGLLAPTETSQFLPPFRPITQENSLWSPMQVEGFIVLVWFREGSRCNWPHIDFTRVGREIGSLLPPPNYEGNLREAAQRLPTDGLTKIELVSSGKPPELIWQLGS